MCPGLQQWVAEHASADDLYHFLALEETREYLAAYVHLFRGVSGHSHGYSILLARLETHVDLPSSFRGHIYLSDEPQPESGHAGTAIELPLTVLS